MLNRVLHRVLVIVNLILSVALVVSFLSVYISPSNFWLPAFIGLLYPFFLLSNVFFLFYWIFRWRKVVWIPLITILLGINHLNSYIQLPFGKRAVTKDTDLRVISYNVNLFRLYSWADGKPVGDSVLAYLRANRFDVACLQEFYVDDRQFSERHFLQEVGMYSYVHYMFRRSGSAYGIVILSRYPIVGSGDVMFRNTMNACIYADIKIEGDTVRVYNLHLQSTRLKPRNYSFLLNEKYRAESNTMEEISDILHRLNIAYTKRALQVDMVYEHVNRSPYPVILCGDFNDPPVSYTYHRLTRNLNDAFISAGVGVLGTYTKIWPSYRIDYILHSSSFATTGYASPRIPYSDHYPVVATLRR